MFIYIAQYHKCYMLQQNINMTIRHPLSLDPHIVQGNTSKETLQLMRKHFRNLEESNRGGIPLPGRTDVK